MKIKITLLCPLILALLLPLHAEESAGSSTKDEKELPEVSNPPYTVGDRATIEGYYIALEDGISLNFRILDSRMYVYWVDEDDLIVEPQATAGNVRFIASVRGPIYFGMKSLENEDGLGSIGGPVFKPHLFTVILSLESTDKEELDTHTFRYTQSMSAVRETRELFIKDNDETKTKGSY